MTRRQVYLVDGLIVLAVLGSIFWVVGRGGKPAGYGCQQTGQQRLVTLSDDNFSPDQLALQRCDSLVISNHSKLAYNLNFGKRQQHIQYPGFSAKTLLPDERQTIRMYGAGNFVLHDHFRDNAQLHLKIND
jgi:hypothetical protein